MRNQTAVHACCITTWSHTNSVLLQSHTIVCIRQAVKIIITMDTNLILIKLQSFLFMASIGLLYNYSQFSSTIFKTFGTSCKAGSRTMSFC